jgi:hypothetical protein
MFVGLFCVFCRCYPNYTFVESDVFARDLIQTVVTPTSLLNESCQVSQKQQPAYANKAKEILAFVTPLHPVGYNLTLDFGSKFTTVVPTWFLATATSDYSITGQNNILTDWIAALRAKHPRIRLVPRVLFVIGTPDFVHNYRTISTVISAALSELYKTYQFNGFFIDCGPYFWSPDSIQLVPHLLRTVKKALPRGALLFAGIPFDLKNRGRSANTKFVKKAINEVDYAFTTLYNLVDQQSLSPIECFEGLRICAAQLKVLSKTIVGLPFFGLDFSPAGKVLVSWEEMQENFRLFKVAITWVQFAREHGFFFSDGRRQHAVYYPTLFFLKDRFDRCIESRFAGFGIWEIALGMPYFFDLL